MPKTAVSVTLEEENLLWLRGRTRALGIRSVSEMLDRLVTDARAGGRVFDTEMRSVAGTLDIAADDPDLTKADETMRALFAASLGRPVMVRERAPERGGKAARKRRRG